MRVESGRAYGIDRVSAALGEQTGRMPARNPRKQTTRYAAAETARAEQGLEGWWVEGRWTLLK